MRTSRVVWVIIVLGISAVVAWRMQHPEAVPVRFAAVAAGTVEATVVNTRAGTVKACQRSHLSLGLGGRVATLDVGRGDQVKRGQRLLSLWNDDLRASVAQSEANLRATRLRRDEACLNADRAERERQRQQELANKNLVADDTLDQYRTQAQSARFACAIANAAIQEAEAALALHHAQLAQTELVAPFDGTIAEINGEIGEYVTPSPPGVATPPAVDLIAADCLYVQAPIDEVDAGKLRVGLPARVTLDAFPERAFDGHIIRIAPYVQDYEKQARTVDVDVGLSPVSDDITLLIGSSADLEIILERHEQTLRVPAEAVLEGNTVLRIGADNRLQRVTFEPGLSNWHHSEVLSGLASGDRVVLSLDIEGTQAGALVDPSITPPSP